MNAALGKIIWQQFGAAIDMLNNAMNACPDDLWTETAWDDSEAV